MKFSSKRSQLLPEIFLASIVATILLSACGAKSTEEEEVRALFAGAEEAAESRDTSDVLEYVAADYSDAQGLDRVALQNFLRGYFLSHPKLELSLTVDALEFPVDGLAQAEITVATLDLANPDLQRLKVELRRQGGEWRVSRADRVGR